MLKDNVLDSALSKEEYEEKNKKKIELQLALKECIFQDTHLKEVVKNEIKKIIQETYKLNDHTINDIINFEDDKKLTVEYKFNIILSTYKKKYNNDALTKLIEKYELDTIKNDDEERYVILKEEIEHIYSKEKIKLTFEEKLDILVQYIYSRYKGFGVIDEILEMNIDGINGGVSGIIGTNSNENEPKSYDSIWIIYKGKSMQLKFISFGSHEELRRICQNIYKFDNPGELSISQGYKINKMKDGSRVVVIRPILGEEWMFFIRKFHASHLSLEELLKFENKELVIELISYIMKGCQNTCISGQQGSGKTTMLLNMIKYIYPVYPIRICETSFELNVRGKFPNRNICTFQETENISGQEALDLSKKTDGLISIIGEVATDEVASQIMQAGQVASKCTIFTHHAKSFKELIMSLRNSLLKTGVFKNEIIAQEQVVNVINFDIHLEKDFYGNRFIERITECIPIDKGDYQARDIVVFDGNKYVFKNKISSKKVEEMKREMKSEDVINFEKFISNNIMIEEQDDACTT